MPQFTVKLIQAIHQFKFFFGSVNKPIFISTASQQRDTRFSFLTTIFAHSVTSRCFARRRRTAPRNSMLTMTRVAEMMQARCYLHVYHRICWPLSLRVNALLLLVSQQGRKKIRYNRTIRYAYFMPKFLSCATANMIFQFRTFCILNYCLRPRNRILWTTFCWNRMRKNCKTCWYRYPQRFSTSHFFFHFFYSNLFLNISSFLTAVSVSPARLDKFITTTHRGILFISFIKPHMYYAIVLAAMVELPVYFKCEINCSQLLSLFFPCSCKIRKNVEEAKGKGWRRSTVSSGPDACPKWCGAR